MKKPYVMFLDFDGPLFSRRALMLAENNEYAQQALTELKMHPLISYWYSDPVAISMLVELYKIRPFKIVVSSTWSDEDLNDQEQIERLLRKNRLSIPFHKTWTTPRNKELRIEQIKEWLENNEYSDYIIVDDNESGYSLDNKKLVEELGLDEQKIVLVSADDGILIRDFYKIQAIMANWN